MGKPPRRPPYGSNAADSRPRIYITATGIVTTCWRNGMHGGRNFAGSAGEALDEALASIRNQPCVIFWEGGPFE